LKKKDRQNECRGRQKRKKRREEEIRLRYQSINILKETKNKNNKERKPTRNNFC
jgi:hypothetical protein